MTKLIATLMTVAVFALGSAYAGCDGGGCSGGDKKKEEKKDSVTTVFEL